MEKRISCEEFCGAGFHYSAVVFSLVDPTRHRSVLGLLDTGAHYSMVSRELAAEIGLVQRGDRPLTYFGGDAVTVPTYPADVLIGDHRFELQLCGSANESLEFIIGRDVLQHAKLEFDATVAHCKLDFQCPCDVTDLREAIDGAA